MAKSTNAGQPADQRAAVKRTMEDATQDQPGEFRDEANEEKIVEVGQDLTKKPIQGIDPKK